MLPACTLYVHTSFSPHVIKRVEFNLKYAEIVHLQANLVTRRIDQWVGRSILRLIGRVDHMN